MAWRPGENLVLTKTVKENIGWIRGAVRAGISAKKTYDMLRSIGTAGRYQAVLDAYRAISYAYSDASVYLPIDTSQRPKADLIPISPFNQRKSYHADVVVTFYNSLDNALEQRPVTVMMNALQPVEDILIAAHELVERYDDFESVQYESSYIESINYSDNPVGGIY